MTDKTVSAVISEHGRVTGDVGSLLEERLATTVLKLEKQLAELRGALHEIYSKACRVHNSYDCSVLKYDYYQFAKEARDIALNAHKAHTEAMVALQGGEKDATAGSYARPCNTHSSHGQPNP